MNKMIILRRLAIPLATSAALCAACGQNNVQPAAPSPGESVAIVADPIPTDTPPSSDQARYAASRFAGAWVRTDLDISEWRTNLAKHSTTQLATQIADTNQGD